MDLFYCVKHNDFTMPAQSCVHRHELTSLSLDYKALTKAIAKKIEPELPNLIQAKQVKERKSNWTKSTITKYLVLFAYN